MCMNTHAQVRATFVAHVVCMHSLSTPNPPTNFAPTHIARVKLPGKFPMGIRIPPLRIKIALESNPLKSIILVRILAVQEGTASAAFPKLNPENSAQPLGGFELLQGNLV